MVKIDQFYVQFEQRWSVYHPGEQVRGQVHLKLNEQVLCDQLQAQFYGSARVFWTERELHPEQLGQMRSLAFHQEKVYFNETQTLWQVDPQLVEPTKKCLAAGTHQFAFEFQLPGDAQTPILQTSFDAKHAHGFVRYFVKVSLMQDDKQKHTRKVYFSVVRPISWPSAGSWTSKEARLSAAASKNVSLLCCMGQKKASSTSNNVNGGELTLLLTLPKTGYVPGEPISACVSLENERNSGLTVKSLRLSLQQHVTCFADEPEPKMRDSWWTVASQVREARIAPGQRLALDMEPIFVPAVVPNFCEPSLLECEYSLVCEAFSRLAKQEGGQQKSFLPALLTVSCPLFIGTVPVQSELLMLDDDVQAVQDTSLFGLLRRRPQPPEATFPAAAASPPPPYRDLVSALAPPTYEESVMGLSPSGLGRDEQGYVPFYEVYRFPSANEPLL